MTTRPGWTLRVLTFDEARDESARSYAEMEPGERVRRAHRTLLTFLANRNPALPPLAPLVSSYETDFAEFIRLLNEHRVRYILVGGQAVIFHGYVRTTDDVDVLIDKTEANIRRAEAAILAFWGERPPPELLRKPEGMVRIGEADRIHIDVLTKVRGLKDFDRLWQRRVRGEFLGQPSQYIDVADLFRAKRAANRAVDRADIEELERVLRAARR